MFLRLQTLSRSFRRMKYLTQTEAQNVSDFHPFVHNTQITQLDKDLMGEEGGFTLQQLMELAGLACAQTVQNLYPAHTHNKVLVAAGSGGWKLDV